MTNASVVLLGSLPLEAPELNRLVQEFGWSFETAANVDQLRDLRACRNLAAILFDASALALSWEQALRELRALDSEALLIPCHRFSDPVVWSDLVKAGAFHALAMPLDMGEVRQSLAFVWSARFRGAKNVLTMPCTDQPPGTDNRANSGRPYLKGRRSTA